MTRPLFYVCVAALLLPFGSKLSTPLLLPLAAQLWQHSSSSAAKPHDTVESINAGIWTIRGSDQSLRLVKLAGVSPIESEWQAQTNGVIAILLQSSQQQIDLTVIHTDKNVKHAIVSLPNGTSIQQVLITDGLAKLDEAQLEQLPEQTKQALQHAQLLAQQQRKNLWG